MKERIKRLLAKWPALYQVAAQVYSDVRPYLIAERIVGTRARERQWATRHRRKGNDWNCRQYADDNNEWVLSYWDSRNHSHRPLLLEKIAAFSPISAILEIGCNCGPNLFLIAQKFPGIEIRGIDINPIAIEKGKELFASEGFANVELSLARADEMGRFADKSYDVVFTDAVLIYIGPDKIRQVVKEMVRLARKGLVLVERHCFQPGNRDRHGLGVRHHGLWHRDYTALLQQFVPRGQIRITKITEDTWPEPGWQETGAVIEVVLGPG